MLESEYSIAVPHVHTSESDGMVKPWRLIYFAKSLGVSVVVIADHDNMNGVAQAIEVGRNIGVDVISGLEVTTNPLYPPGHFIGLNIKEPIEPFQGIDRTIEQIKKQGGLGVLPHPGVSSFGDKRINQMIEEHQIDAIEVISGGFRYNRINDLPGKSIAPLGSSDSHFGSYDLLNGFTLFPGQTAEDFLKALKERTTIPCPGTKSFPGARMFLMQQFKSIVSFGPQKYRDYLQNQLAEVLKTV